MLIVREREEQTMRISGNDIENGIVKNGFDYELQVWVSNWIIRNLMTAQELGIVGKDIRTVKRI